MESLSCLPWFFLVPLLLVPARTNYGIPHVAVSNLTLDSSCLDKQTTGYRWSQWSNTGLKDFCQPHKWGYVASASQSFVTTLSYESDKFSWVSSALTLLWKSWGGDRGDRWQSACFAYRGTWVCPWGVGCVCVQCSESDPRSSHMCTCKHTHTHTQLTSWLEELDQFTWFLVDTSRATPGLAISELTRWPLFSSPWPSSLILSPPCLCLPTLKPSRNKAGQPLVKDAFPARLNGAQPSTALR